MENKVYEIITNQVIEKLEQGVIPWKKPWNTAIGIPKNYKSQKEYRGINIVLLGLSQYNSPYWLSFKQVNEMGGSVNAGEHGTLIVFYKWLEYEDKDNPESLKRFPMLRYYKVFNLEQTTGIEYSNPKEIIHDNNKITNCECIVNGYIDKPEIHNGLKACYSPMLDYIEIPKIQTFQTSEYFYSTLFHEMVHSAGHEKRLNRKTLTDLCPFGSSNYSKEELVAEMGAAFLCNIAGIENKTIENNVAYIQSWLKALRNDKKLVVLAAGAAQKSVDYIQNIKAN